MAAGDSPLGSRHRDADIAVGRVRRAHGVRGLVRVESLSGEFEHFTSMTEVSLREASGASRTYRVEHVRVAVPTILMKLEGVDDRDAASSIAGREIWVDRRCATRLGPDEFYHADLIGCEVRQEGVAIGTVTTVLDTGAGEVLEVIPEGGGRGFMVPFRHAFVIRADVDAGILELAPRFSRA